MTRDEARQLLPIIQAYAEGKEIQVFTIDDEWETRDDDMAFTSPPSRYRIKPEPVECWAVVANYAPQKVLRFHFTEIDARCDADDCIDCRVIRMREVCDQ